MESLRDHFPYIGGNKIAKFDSMAEQYKDWNQKINLISRKDIDNFYTNHLLHSLSIAKFINFKPGTKVMDAGTGGGLPGLPLAIMYPAVEFLLVDSTKKKLDVVDEIAKELNLTNITTQHQRLAQVTEEVDFVVSRAVSRLDTMWSWVAKNIKPNGFNDHQNGLIYLKGGDIQNELPKKTIVQNIDINSLYGSNLFDSKNLVYLKKH